MDVAPTPVFWLAIADWGCNVVKAVWLVNAFAHCSRNLGMIQCHYRQTPKFLMFPKDEKSSNRISTHSLRNHPTFFRVWDELSLASWPFSRQESFHGTRMTLMQQIHADSLR